MSAEGSSANPASTAPLILRDRYELGERLAEGTIFFTYRGRDTETEQPVAIKVLKPEYAADEAFATRLLTESQAAGRLHHPNIARVLDAWRERGTVVMVTEWVRGINLKDRIRRVAPFPLAVAVDILNACSQALNYAHETGVAHGDVRPDNVIITPDGRVKLTDFGVGASAASSSRIQLNALPRAACYMAPELAAGRSPDTRSDIYSLGCILYEMLAGVVPYDGESPIAIAARHLHDAVPSLKQANPSVPAAVDGLAARCMQKDPAERYGSPHELQQDIQKIRDALRAGESLNWTPLAANSEEAALARNTTSRSRSRARQEPAEVDSGPSFKLLLGVALLGLVMIVVFFGLVMMMTSAPSQVPVPELARQTRERAIQRLQELGLKPEVQEDYHEGAPENTVFRTEPPPGTEIRGGKTVTLFISRGPEPVKVPPLVGKELADAKSDIVAAGLAVGETREEYSDVIRKGEIIAQAPAAGSDAKKASLVALVVSKGPEPLAEPEEVQVDPALQPGSPTDVPAPDSPDQDVPETGHDVAFQVPVRSSGPQMVRIVVRHGDGREETQYEQEHAPGDNVDQRVMVRAPEGRGQIRVYLKERLIYRKNGPPFDE